MAESVMRRRIVCLALAGGIGLSVAARVLWVGEGCPYRMPSLAAAAAKDGDTVEIAPGTYKGDVCVWRANRLTIRGAGAARTILDADGRCCQGKGAWIVRGQDCTISGMSFRGASCKDRNGAAIRYEADGALSLVDCRFTENENGILCGVLPKATVKITGCIFDRNGAGDGYSHNLYIGKIARLELERCSSHHARVGHNLKSRAMTTVVRDCTFDDGRDGTSSYLVDCPNGGRVSLVRCRFVQAPTASNGTMVSIGEEGACQASSLLLADCTFVNHRSSGREVFVAPSVQFTRRSQK